MSFRKPMSVLLLTAVLSSCLFVRASDISSSGEQQTNMSINNVAAGSAQTTKNERPAPLVEKYLQEGKLQAGQEALLARLRTVKSDSQARFGLGVLQFLRGVERLVQDLYRYGLSDFSDYKRAVPIFRLPLKTNPAPEVLSYSKARLIVQTFLANLTAAEATLSQINDADVKLPLHFGLIRLDLDGDGRADENESLWNLYSRLNGSGSLSEKKATEFLICFDRGDVHWLRGYCHLLMAMCEICLAHDTREMFECTAHLFFAKVETPCKFLSNGKHLFAAHENVDFSDLVAFVHLIRWSVAEPERMEAALHHLEAMVAQSKEMWKWILLETDDDHEWIPNPRQTGVIPGVQVTDQMIGAWIDLMNQTGKLLAGKLLIPFWRGNECRGVNLRRVFLEPRPLDLVLWVQGSAAAPYLENGEKTKPETWTRLQRVFGGEFIGFALWFN